MEKYNSDWTLKACGIFGSLILLMSLFSVSISSAIDGIVVGFIGMSVIILIDHFFTYLKINSTTRQVTALSFLFSQNRVKIDSITRITKEPHPIFKEISWAIFIHYKNEKEKEKHFEIWPSFSPETMGKFLTEIEKLNPKIHFDDGCKEWMKEYGNA